MSTPHKQEHGEQQALERVFPQVLAPAQVTLFVNPRNHTIAVFGGMDSPQNAIEKFTLNE